MYFPRCFRSHLHMYYMLERIKPTFKIIIAYGIRHIVGDEVFQDLLQLRKGNSLVFVIDTTGSMGKDLAAVQQKTKEIVQETQGTANAPYNYILVTFNDPGKV